MANTNDMNTPTKVPCGGFVLGEGLALSKDGKTLNVTGGGSQADWNQNNETQPDYIKNRPFYTGDPVQTVLVEESTVSFTNVSANIYYGAISTTIELAAGETYEVSWDGAVYECVCESVSGFPAIGNMSIIGAGADTGEPFAISPLADNRGTEIYTLDTSASHAISISRMVAPVVKIDEKYLPDILLSFKPAGKSYLTFSSLSSFTLKVKDSTKHWDGTLEYFASDKTWTVWDGTNALSAVAYSGEYVLYLRGIGNTIITGHDYAYNWVLTGTDIKCIGNIENLLDYATVESGDHPTMAPYCYGGMFSSCSSLTQAPALPATTLENSCYKSMFYGCTSLTQAPALPATTLAEGCYQSMFQNCTSLTQAPALPATTLATSCYDYMFINCTSLTQAPALPATTLANGCYKSMFDGCTNLTQAPALPATTLAEGCYSSMFKDCTSLKLSSTKTDEYTQEYRIPSSGDGATATNALFKMFIFTGGTFTGTPEINTTYYLSSNNMIVRETDIATLNGYVGSMIDAAIDKYECIIPSSTAGSTKKFKITVDDSGTISATEVTA